MPKRRSSAWKPGCDWCLFPGTDKIINPFTVLLNGQSFRWARSDDDESIVGVAKHRVWKIRRHDEDNLAFRVLARFPSCPEGENDSDVLRQYFQMDVDLEKLYTEWGTVDEHFASILAHSDQFEGVRILDQDLLETLFAFICSANNNIQRISNMVNTLATLFGPKVTDPLTEKSYHDFPNIAQLSVISRADLEKLLRERGFGYRAAYIANTVSKLSAIEANIGLATWERQLREMPYPEARAEILKLDGVGPKVADCICLMALRHSQVVPVDTHVFQITVQHYIPELGKYKSVTDAVYRRISAFYVERFGEYAGWVHSVLFSTRLRHFASDASSDGGGAQKKLKRK